MKNISRRLFLKHVGMGSAAVAVSQLPGCASDKQAGQQDAGSMEHRTNPNSGDSVSLLGFGCMRFPTFEKPGADGNPVDQEKTNQLIDYALEHGVTYFDTAPVYHFGWSEVAVGNALSRHPRNSYFIATKLSSMQDPTFENSLQMYHSSMEKLKVDYLDYYLLHSVGGGRDPLATFNKRFIDNGVLDYLLEERKAGRIRNLGFSFHGDVRFFDYLLSLHEKIHWDFVQIQMNYSDWKNPGSRTVSAEYLYNELDKLEIPVVVMEPLLGGRLAKLPDNIVARLLQRDPDHSVASWAFRFVGSFPRILTVLSGMAYLEHLEDNIDTYSHFRPLEEDDYRFLEETVNLMREYPTIPCNDCKYCMPCPYGLDIPAILLYYNKCINEDLVAHQQSENYSRARRAFLAGYDRNIPKERQADHCIGCNECMKKCPQSDKIDIPGSLHRIDRYVESLRRNMVVLSELKEQLFSGRCSLVIAGSGVSTRKFSGKGVSDLYKLYTSGNVEGTCAADKIVGRGAALLMSLLGFNEIYAETISVPAIEFFRQKGIRVQYGNKVDEIMNNEGNDICPVEKICKEHGCEKETVPLIGEFLKSVGLI